MPASQAGKTQFTELEAATELGLSIEQLRSAIRNIVAEGDTDPGEFAVAQLQAADVLLLKLVIPTCR